MTWTNLSSDPSSDERVLRDAQKTIEKVVEAARVALDDELAVQQMEYDQVYGLNSMQFAMYQTLVMTFFQDHQMLASLNLKRTRPDLSNSVNESKRAQLMEVITQRVSTNAQPQPQTVMPQAQEQAWQQNGLPQPPPPKSWNPPANSVPVNGTAAAASSSSWLDPAPARAAAGKQEAPGDWLSKTGNTERPPSSAWPDSGNDSGTTWQLKPGAGQPPAIPASDNGSGWSSGGGAWPSENASGTWPTPATAANSSNGTGSSWPSAADSAPTGSSQTAAQAATAQAAAAQAAAASSHSSSWPEQPNLAKQPPAAAWPASNSGAPPREPEMPSAQPQPGIVKPAWSAPIGESGQSGTWTLKGDEGKTAPPAPAWASQGNPNSANQTIPGQAQPGQMALPAQTQPGQFQQPGQMGGQPGQPPAPAWSAPANSTPPNGLPAPAWASSQPTPTSPTREMPPSPPSQPGQNTQPWQSPAGGPAPVSNPAGVQPWQGGTTGTNPAASPPSPQAQPWTPPNASGQPQPWQPPAEPVQPVWQGQQPSPNQPQPWQGAPQPAAQQPLQMQSQQQHAQPHQAHQAQQQAAQPWQQPLSASQMPGAPQGIPAAPPNPWENGGGNGAANPWGNQPPSAVAQPQPQSQPAAAYPPQQGSYQGQSQQQYPGQQQPQQPYVPGSTQESDLSISFNQQANQQQQGATLGGVLRQMRNFDSTRRRSDDEEPKYDPNNAW